MNKVMNVLTWRIPEKQTSKALRLKDEIKKRGAGFPHLFFEADTFSGHPSCAPDDPRSTKPRPFLIFCSPRFAYARPARLFANPRLHQPTSKTVVLTEKGPTLAERLFKTLFVKK